MSSDAFAVVSPPESDEFFTEERCHILEAWNDPRDPGISVARARVEPGVTTELHVLDGVAERYLVTQGSGEIELEGEWVGGVGQGDFVYIPAGVAQRVRNTGTKDLVFYCICTPAWREGMYRSLE